MTKDRKGTPKIIQLLRQAQGLAPNPEEESALKKLTPHVPGIVTFANHSRVLPWTTSYTTVLMFADISGFTAICEKYGAMQNAGIDQLTKTLNDYLGEIVENIISSEGDVLKFAGDAILAVWRVNNDTELNTTVDQVVKCCLNIQDKCGAWETDIGVTLTVKMGVSAGEMSVTFLGNDEYRVYVELGPAIREVNEAEHHCGAGHIVLSPTAWELCSKSFYNYELLPDQQHARIISFWRPRLSSKEESKKDGHLWFMRKRRMGGDWGVAITGITAISAFSEGTSKSLFTKPIPIVNEASTSKSCDDETSDVNIPTASSSRRNSEPARPTIHENTEENHARPGRPKLGLNKLRSVVKTVREMRLDESLRLYILHPVLKKLDDNQPLEYLSEMRNVTVVFMNLVLEEGRDITQLLQEVFEVVYSQSKVMHGCLNKVFFFDKGCTFLLIFGLPGYKHERDCAHALICSHKMKSILDKHAGVSSVSIGVTTGGTFCGVVGHKNRHEYSVIGRKVNMAARLMMHYPNKVTCGERTFQQSRLPSINFRVLGAKRMKGLQNVGVIREYVESSETSTQSVAKIPYFQFPILGRENEIELIDKELQKLVSLQKSLDHYIISGASGIGKTRLLDHYIHLAELKNLSVISCALRLHHLHISNCLSNYIFQVLLSSSGFSDRIDTEPEIMKSLATSGLDTKLYLLNGIQGSNYKKLSNTQGSEEDLSQILKITIEKCTVKQPVLVLVDDAQNVDNLSWKFLCELQKMAGVLIVLSSRPAAVERPPCEHAEHYMESPSVRVIDLGVLDTRHIPALACQIMDVVRIPCELETMLRERAQGVPYWCEQLLLDMTEKKQLIVTYDDGSNAMRENTIAPNAAQLKKVFSDHSLEEILDENDNDEIEYNRVSSSFKVKEDEVNKQSQFDQGMLLGYCLMPHKDNKPKVKVAMFSQLINPKDIEVPLIMKELIIARLDSMRASEQLIVKCAAVLGQTFPRDMIEYILPKVQRVKARKSFKRLKQIGIFECANIPTGRAALLLQTNGLHPEACFCPKMEDDYNADLCNVMRFKNNLLQQTAYNILMESQRLDLHNKTVEYLQNQANEIRKRIPYYLLYRKPKESLDHVQQERRTSIFNKKSNQVGAAVEEDEEDAEDLPRMRRRGAVYFPKEEIDPLIKAVCQLDDGLEKIDELVKRLIPLYQEMVRHMRAAKDPKHVVDVLLEHAAAVILLKDTEKAKEILNTVDELLQDIPDMKFTSDIFRLSKIDRIRGKAAYYAGDLEEAQRCLRHAAKLLGIKQPSTPITVWWLTVRSMVHVRALRNSPLTRRPSTDKTLEQGFCLSDLQWLYRECGNLSLMFLTTLQQMLKVTGRTCHLHQVIESYTGALKLCKIESTKKKLETELFDICASRHEELSPSDLVMLAGMYTDMSINHLNSGKLKMALSCSKGAYEVCDRLNNQDIGLVVSPVLACCLILTRSDQFSEFLQRLRSFICYSDGRNLRAWYYIFCMEGILNGDYPVQSAQCCLDFATNYLRSFDAVHNEYVPRLFLAMAIAVWYCRKGQWELAQNWFDYSELFETSIVSFLSLHALSRKIEVMLLSFNTSRATKSKKALKQLKKQISKDLKKLYSGCNKITSMLPRYYHLLAYFNILRRRRFLCKWYLKKSSKIAEKHGNQLEKDWVKRHRLVWLEKVDLSDHWSDITDMAHAQWKPREKGTSHLYTWPIVPKTSERSKPMSLHFDTAIK
uniref:Adenylate cyclase type 10-like n=1 Tax=Crassostrea virginica TaxID=6565 RepID=A0A8B8DUJ2_CRAVI|nr:adenylate cyclase type 10-like [Crassostrea virginica]